ncbi:MAG: DNA polymerase III subunit gamma/tau [Chloroflexi bacterium]|nr:DNA polymerase III subunit gamma/tau [Chloroflexota bacterium]
MSQAYYRKWRPQTWDEVVSQEHVVQTLRNAVRTGRTGHAYLFAGPRGTGKTTMARLLAKALNCLDDDPARRPCDSCEHCKSINAGRFLDLIEIDAASNTSVDDVRDLRDKINFAPTQGRYKVYIIDEVHMLSTAAFNALLKTLEEPPPHAVFILATTEVHKIPATILSRVQRYEFRRIPVAEIVRYLKEKAAEEKLDVDDEVLQLIARQATGAMRDAISLLDQLSSTGQRVTMEEAQVVLGTATSSLVVDLVKAVLEKDAASGMRTIQAALDAGTDARQFARQVVDYLRGLLLVRMGNADQLDATAEMRAIMAGHARAFETPQLLETIRLFNNAAADSRGSWHPGLALELALAEAVEEKTVVTAPVPPVAPGPAQSGPAPGTGSTGGVLYQSGPAESSPTPARGAAVYAPAASGAAQREAEPQPQRRPAEETTRRAEKPQTPPPPAQAADLADAAPGGRTVTQQDIQQNWQRIRQMVRRSSKMAEGLLNSARSVSLKGDTLVLGYQTDVLKSKMETAENIDATRQALQTILGVRLNVKCIVVGSRGGMQASDADIDGDGMVGTALDLGGKIVYDE